MDKKFVLRNNAHHIIPDRQKWKGKERPGVLLARRAPTMKQWSLDARSNGPPRPLL